MNQFIIINIILYLINKPDFNKNKRLIIKFIIIFIYKQSEVNKENSFL